MTPSFLKRQPLPLLRIDLPSENLNERFYRLGECTVYITRDADSIWRLSIAHTLRYPHWDEICEARYRLLPDRIMMALKLPPSNDYINFHKNCFQLIQVPLTDDTPEYRDQLRREGDKAGPLPSRILVAKR